MEEQESGERRKDRYFYPQTGAPPKAAHAHRIVENSRRAIIRQQNKRSLGFYKSSPQNNYTSSLMRYDILLQALFFIFDRNFSTRGLRDLAITQGQLIALIQLRHGMIRTLYLFLSQNAGKREKVHR